MGVMLVNVNQCLPEDYFASFGAAGRTAVLDAFAEAVFNTVIDALFPQADGDTDVDTTNGANNGT
jgi:hypothetical protein